MCFVFSYFFSLIISSKCQTSVLSLHFILMFSITSILRNLFTYLNDSRFCWNEEQFHAKFWSLTFCKLSLLAKKKEKSPKRHILFPPFFLISTGVISHYADGRTGRQKIRVNNMMCSWKITSKTLTTTQCHRIKDKNKVPKNLCNGSILWPSHRIFKWMCVHMQDSGGILPVQANR